MTRLRDAPIRVKLTRIMMLTSGAALLLACSSLTAYNVYRLRQNVVEDLTTSAKIIEATTAAALAFGDSKSATEILAGLSAHAELEGVRIYSRTGQVFAEFHRGSGPLAFRPSEPQPEGVYFTAQNVLIVHPILLDGEKLGTLYIQSDLRGMWGQTLRAVGITVILLLVSFGVALTMSSVLRGVISDPIVHLARVVKVVTEQKDYSVRAVAPGKDELGTLITGFNDMLTQIQIRDQELEGHRGRLEEEVANRTAELRGVNSELEVARDRAEAASRAKSEFLANMSHEIRTPMNGILGMAELALESEQPAERQEYLKIVLESGQSLLRVINDILDFSKIEAGKLDLDVIQFHLPDCFEESVKALALPAHQKGLELVARVGAGVPAVVSGDPGRLRQVLINLVGNAVKFTEKGEVLADVQVESQDNERVWLSFSVRDTGVGIDLAKQRDIFEAFTQADGSTTRKYGGSGLGLTISARLVAMMGGALRVESEPGRGSVFTFRACFAPVRQAGTATVPLQLGDLSSMRVLVVDDNATNRRVLEEMLQRWKMIPVSASGGVQAMQLWEASMRAGQAFPLVLLDAAMPDMDGFTLAARIQKDLRGQGPAIMMLSSAAQRGDSARCREMGLAAYLVKPVRQAELLAAILLVLGRAQQHKPDAPLLTRDSLREVLQGLRILVAEDNPVNQMLARRTLEKRGHSVSVAPNGREALEALARERFDLVFMDLQMPEMGGLETVASLREQERASGKHMPVIAMTAHAMQGDRERCLEAGMDDYISKPVRPAEMFRVIERIFPHMHKSAEQPEPAALKILDESQLLAQTGGDHALLEELAGIFRRDSVALLANIIAAVKNRDARGLEHSAHCLKGALMNFGAQAAVAACQSLETRGHTGNLEGASADCAELERNVAALNEALAALNPSVPTRQT